ncbi:hypothetical protein QFZ24_006845 [Streptomyces phaeochromogenes]|jgi:hypothetical protein|uniref:DUF4333 domain-containing protein n=1 Tax=Streptomyces phaeochromogenes TaxID=1923 RepID=UPI00278ED458|nr:DUF4333 domain-containing protein [Streptomyces phaeochromogenes]MDQ0952922.1 hypothetical protein [Streptomyces phaeochromogenes]
MQRKHLIVIGGTAVALVGGGAGVTYAVSGTQSTTELDSYSTVTVDGHKALSAQILGGRIQSKYRPLPWIGRDIGPVSCPSGLKAVAGASLTCTAEADGKRVEIPVSVVKAGATSITWKFER